jgi:dTDP-4-dehydrorhamnose 3,5-epimerase
MNTSFLYTKSEILGIDIITPYIFEDFRGEFVELFNKDKCFKFSNFVQDDISTAHKNVLKGIHGDYGTWKLVTCLKGTVYVVIVNNNKESETYKKWESFTLNDKNRIQLLIPPGFGNSYLAITDDIIYYYKQSTNYGDFKQFTLKWNDPELNIYWPLPNTIQPILSERDK